MKRRRSQPRSFDEKPNAEKARVEAQLGSALPGVQRDLLERKLRQIQTAIHIDNWVTSPGLQPPKLKSV